MADENPYYTSYKDFATTLRTWLVAYGIGGPVIVLSQQHVWAKIDGSDAAIWAGGLFLSGVVLQVLFALLFKWAMWILYAFDTDALKATNQYKIAYWVSDKYFIDVIADLGSLILFSTATFLLVATIFGA